MDENPPGSDDDGNVPTFSDPALGIHDPVEDVAGFGGDTIKRNNFREFLRITEHFPRRTFLASIEKQCGRGAVSRIPDCIEFDASAKEPVIRLGPGKFAVPFSMRFADIVTYLMQPMPKEILIGLLKKGAEPPYNPTF